MTTTIARVAVIFSVTLSLFVLCHACHFNPDALQEESSIAVGKPVAKSYPETSLQVLEQSLDRASATASPIVESIAIALPQEERTTDAALAEITYSDNINEFSRRPKSMSDEERKLYPLKHHLGLQMDTEGAGYAAAKDNQMVGIMRGERDVEVAYKDNDDDDDNDEEEEDDDEEEEEEEEVERVKREKSIIRKQYRSLTHEEEKEKGKKKKGMERLTKPKHTHEDEQEEDKKGEEREEREESRIMKRIMKRIKKRAHKDKKRKECWFKKRFRKLAHKKKGKELEVEKETGGFLKRIGRFVSRFFQF